MIPFGPRPLLFGTPLHPDAGRDIIFKLSFACVDAEGMVMQDFEVQIRHDGNKNCNVVEER
jgi:hypothetical protein